MKPSKQLSLIALLSILALTACTSNDDAKKNETTSVASGAQDIAPSADEMMTGTENSGATISASSDKDEVVKEESETNEKDSNKTPTSEKLTKKPDMNKEEDSDDKDSDGDENENENENEDENEDEDDDKSGSAPSPATITNTVTTPAKNTPASTASSPSTKSGQANYKTPAGSDSMKVSITTKNGIITGASVTPMATNAVSLQYQQSFAGKISGSVVGKSIKWLKVDTVSGASLTTAAFNDFLASNSN